MRNCLLSFILLLLAACDIAGEADEDEIIRLSYVADEGLGGIGGSELTGLQSYARAAAHTGLTARAADGRIIPGLATSWRVLDEGRAYIFKLRAAEWPDGRRITAGDVVAVLRRQVVPGSAAPLKPYLLALENAPEVAANRVPPQMLGVDDPLPDVVAIRLSRPEPHLLALLAHPSLGIVRSRDDPPPPSGAYRIEQGEDEQSRELLLSPNPAWYGAGERPVFPVLLHEQLAADAAIAAFETGETDIVFGGATEGLRRVRTEDLAAALRLEPTWGLYGYLARTGNGPLADPRVRRALAMTVDREALIGDLFALSGMEPAYGPLPPTLPPAYAGAVPDWTGWSPEARQAEAARLLAEAGYDEPTPLLLDVALPRGSVHELVLGYVAADWAPLNVRVRAYKRGAAGHAQAVEDGDYDLALIERIAPVPIARYFLMPLTCAQRLGGYCSQDADRLLSRADREADPGTRIELTRRAARLIADDAPVLPLFAPVRWALVRPGIEGWNDNIAGAHPPRFLRPAT